MPNKKYYQLDNKEWLKQALQKMTMAELAASIGAHRTSVEFASRHFSDDVKATFLYARRHTKDQA